MERVSDCEELVGEVNHTTESVTDPFSFVNVEWIRQLSNSSEKSETSATNL